MGLHGHSGVSPEVVKDDFLWQNDDPKLDPIRNKQTCSRCYTEFEWRYGGPGTCSDCYNIVLEELGKSSN